MTQEAFDLPWPESKRRVRHEGELRAREAREAKGLRYERVTTASKPKCDACVGAMLAGGKMKAPDPVAYVRRSPEGVMYLCYPHTQALREKDGMAPIKPRQ